MAANICTETFVFLSLSIKCLNNYGCANGSVYSIAIMV